MSTYNLESGDYDIKISSNKTNLEIKSSIEGAVITIAKNGKSIANATVKDGKAVFNTTLESGNYTIITSYEDEEIISVLEISTVLLLDDDVKVDEEDLVFFFAFYPNLNMWVLYAIRNLFLGNI